MYSSLPTLVIGFHGCDEAVQQKVLLGQEDLKKSDNKYDWLGSGTYFWENNHQRALEYAQEIKAHPERHSTSIKTPAVIGAIIDVGNCFNLLDSRYIKILKEAYDLLKEVAKKAGDPLPENEVSDDGGFSLKRNLDRLVIEVMHQIIEKQKKEPSYDTVRGVFPEGGKLYPGAGFYKKVIFKFV